ncbi:MAG: hypothetical protein RL328_1061 [Acidobacteriota bacterium]|jgi:hypothetical protein
MATLTATAAITASLQLLGVLDSGGAPSTAQKDDGLLYLQNMIDNANDDPKMAISSTVVTQALSGSSSYTLGTRYSKVLAASLDMANGVGMPVRVLQDAGQWYNLVDRLSTSLLVQYVWYDRAASSPKIWVSPVAASGTLNLVVPTPITNFSDLTTPVTMLQGYELWIKANLADILASTYGMATPKSVTDELTRALTIINTLNAELLTPSPAVPPVPQNVVTA